MKKVTRILLQVGILLGYLGTVVVNALANILPINGLQTGELSDAIPNLFVPAGLTFTVWAVIYIALFGLTVYSIKSWFIKEEEPPELLEFYGIEFIVSSIANIAWILLWHYQLVGLSLIAMLVLLAALLSAYIRLQIGKKEELPLGEQMFIHIPLSIYLGWITIATVANVTAVLVDVGWNRFGASEAFWTIFVLIVATIITALMLLLRKDIAYSLVVIWAFIGIIIKRLQTTPAQPGIVITTSVGIGVIVLLIAFVIYWHYLRKPKEKDLKVTTT